MSPGRVPGLHWGKSYMHTSIFYFLLSLYLGQKLKYVLSRFKKKSQDLDVHCDMLQNLAWVQLMRLLVWTETAGRRKFCKRKLCLHACITLPKTKSFNTQQKSLNHWTCLNERNAQGNAMAACYVSSLLLTLDTYRGLFSWRPQGIAQKYFTNH